MMSLMHPFRFYRINSNITGIDINNKYLLESLLCSLWTHSFKSHLAFPKQIICSRLNEAEMMVGL